MRVQAQDGEWGSIRIEPEGQTVRFCAEGRAVDAVWRIWGMSEGREPLLIGVPEPNGDHMVLERTLPQTFLARCGYWPELPQRYGIGPSPEEVCAPKPSETRREHSAIQQKRVGKYMVLRCAFRPDRPFALAYLFCFCRIHGTTAEVWMETKTGRPLWDPPENHP